METDRRITGAKKEGIGALLVRGGAITSEQLGQALQLQREKTQKGSRGLLGQTLVEMGFTTEEALTKALAYQSGVEYVSLETYGIDNAAAGLIDPDSARRYQSLPIGFENGRLVVAMMHPNDIVAIDDLRLISGHEVKPVSVSDSELKIAIEQYASAGAIVDAGTDDDTLPDAEDVQSTATDKPAVQLANIILNQAIRNSASDVHIEPQEKSLRIRFRIDGVLHEVMRPPVRLHPSLVSRVKVMANMDIANRRSPQDGRTTRKLDNRVIDFRVASLPTAYGEKITLRLLDRSARLITLPELGFPEAQLELFRKIIKKPHGCILVTGPTGSGKSTTLYAALSELNSVEKHIITVEDPIEYRLAGINQVQVNPRAGLTFATGLRSILRNDPDIIMIGEIRDRETSRIAIESALTGHLVLSTLHTNDAAGAVTRLGDMDIEPYLTASSVIGVLAQRLVRLLCLQCRKKHTVHREKLLMAVPDYPLANDEKEATIYQPVGCLRCSNTGYSGRRGVYELLVISDNIKPLILQRRSSGEIADVAAKGGMISMRRDGLLKVSQGLTSLEEVLRVLA
ncbi:MAG TPA: ATPase, T2SS/T4P/T4SS family [Candidatus Limnocylindrales bacterium]|nr:ATPase, T2SS/T4P/T4SS family [Candidatus Limnocylindrales bacterium]